jgi:hypothetical protein
MKQLKQKMDKKIEKASSLEKGLLELLVDHIMLTHQ